MRFPKTVLLLVIILCCSSNLFSQSPPPELIVRDKLPLPGPLCLIVFKGIAYSIEGESIDSLIVPKTIKRLKIEKADAAWEIYGSRAVNGVVIIIIDDNVASKEYYRLKPYITRYAEIEL